MLKDLFDRGKCTLGFHADTWRYARDGSCRQTSVCARCQTVSERVLHDWPDSWSRPAAAECQVVRRCRRCGEQESKIEHEWGSPIYKTGASCDQVRPCARCGAQIAAATVHLWDAWTYNADEGCAQTVRCSRCATPGTAIRVRHDWTDWQHSAFYEARVRVCRRCAEMVFDVDAADENGDALSFQRAATSVNAVMQAADSAALRDSVLRHQRELFTPVADKYIRFALDQLAPDAAARQALQALPALLERCQREGIDGVFSR